MARQSSAPPSPQARRQAQQLALQAALAARDPRLVSQLLGQWVHRHGLGSTDCLWAELTVAEPEGCAWWQGLGSTPMKQEPPRPAPLPHRIEPHRIEPHLSEPLQSEPLRIEPQLPRPGRPAPAPSHPALVQLRTWLPDQESRRAA